MAPWILLLALWAPPEKILYITHSAGFRHDCLPVSQQTLFDIGARTGKLQITATEDLSALNDLREYAAVAFFTSGELALSDTQKESLLAFIRNGGGFAGFHSATDTLYTWPEYGDLIGARFDGHPWTQSVRIDIEDPDHPAVRHLAPSFMITEEIYQFREFTRDRVRVLMTLDNPGDFPLAWTRAYGNGRVFYTALGHFEDTWRDARFQQMVEQSLLWVTKQIDGEVAPQPVVQPTLAPNGLGNSATMLPPMTIFPGSYVSLYGSQLTSGGTMAADLSAPSSRLAGTRVLMNGRAVPITYASPGQVNVFAPNDLQAPAQVVVEVPRSGPLVIDVFVQPPPPM
jgi:type 1 glutamine amidotransferase